MKPKSRMGAPAALPVAFAAALVSARLDDRIYQKLDREILDILAGRDTSGRVI